MTQAGDDQLHERLQARVEKFLDGRLDDDEAIAFEGELRADGSTRRALVDALTLRAMVDLAMAPASERALEAEPRAGPRRGWLVVACLTLAVVGAFSLWGTVLRDDEPGQSSAIARSGWPELPVDLTHLEQVLPILGSLAADKDVTATTPALERILPAGPAAAALEHHSVVLSELARIGATGFDDASRREITALLLVLNDRRLTFGKQSRALGPLILRVGVTSVRPLLLERALRADESGAMSVHVAQVAPLLGPTDMPVIERLLHHARRVPAAPVIGTLVSRLGQGGFERGAATCLDVLVGEYGSWDRDLLARAAFECVRAAMRDPRDDRTLVRMQDMAAGSTERALRCYAADALLLHTKADRWVAALQELAARDDDVGARARRALRRPR